MFASKYGLNRGSSAVILAITRNVRTRPHLQLQVRFGRVRTIKFGDYMAREQAEKVLDMLVDSLPEVAQKLLTSHNDH